MGEGTQILLCWLLGWALLSIGYFINGYIIEKNGKSYSWKYWVWESFWMGMWSWIGILILAVFVIVLGIATLNEYIENKLK